MGDCRYFYINNRNKNSGAKKICKKERRIWLSLWMLLLCMCNQGEENKQSFLGTCSTLRRANRIKKDGSKIWDLYLFMGRVHLDYQFVNFTHELNHNFTKYISRIIYLITSKKCVSPNCICLNK